MKNLKITFVATACAVILATGSATLANPAGLRAHPRAVGHAVTAQQKAASDQAMQTGLTALQAASAAWQSGNAGQTGSSLQAAGTAMQQALPIYDGHREASIHAAGAAYKLLQGTGKNAGKRVAAHIARAIQDAQAALQTN